MNKNDFLIDEINGRWVALKGIGKMFYQDGFPISMAVSELKKDNIEVSFFHLVEEFWNNGWSWETIEKKLKGELADDIDKSLEIDFNKLGTFYGCLEQPYRKNGGYEKSREMIFEYLFGCSTDDVRAGNNTKSLDFLRKKSDENIKINKSL